MRGFIDELKHRNVFRVGVAYAVVGWLLAQVADLIVDAFNLPDSFLQMVIVLLLLGFPVALFLAWAFELTPDGVKKAKDLPADMPKDPRSGRILNRITIATLVIIIAGLVWDRMQTVTAPTAGVADKSIAVLPFADFSADSSQGWFADGLTDEILNALARTPSLRVASRTSSFAYRDSDKDIPQIADELGVAHVLEGSVRHGGDRIRVTAQLIRASDDAHLWSQTFDASSADSIDIQEEIAFEIASLLDTAMDPDELRRMVAAGTDSIAAWEAYLQMRETIVADYDNFIVRGRNDEVLALYEEINREDAGFGAAHQVIADLTFSWLDPSNIAGGPAELSVAEIRQMFFKATATAARHARSEDARLAAEILRARFDNRFADWVELTRRRVELGDNNRLLWVDHLDALISTSQFEAANQVATQALSHEFPDSSNISDMLAYTGRLNAEMTLPIVRREVAKPGAVPSLYYQAQRIMLYANLLEEAARYGQRYKEVADDPTWTLMVNIRQACAEGRTADADRYYAEYDFSRFRVGSNNIQWLALKTLGRVDEANELLRELDEPENLFSLASLLDYSHFDPRPYPNLSRQLDTQGFMREAPLPMPYMCKR